MEVQITQKDILHGLAQSCVLAAIGSALTNHFSGQNKLILTNYYRVVVYESSKQTLFSLSDAVYEFMDRFDDQEATPCFLNFPSL